MTLWKTLLTEFKDAKCAGWFIGNQKSNQNNDLVVKSFELFYTLLKLYRSRKEYLLYNILVVNISAHVIRDANFFYLLIVVIKSLYTRMHKYQNWKTLVVPSWNCRNLSSKQVFVYFVFKRHIYLQGFWDETYCLELSVKTNNSIQFWTYVLQKNYGLKSWSLKQILAFVLCYLKNISICFPLLRKYKHLFCTTKILTFVLRY